MAAVEKSDFPHLAELQPHFQDPTRKRLEIFNYLALRGRDENTKQFVNQLFIHVALRLKKPDGTPFAPNTVTTMMRTLFAFLRQEGSPWEMKDFQKWPGSFIDVVDQAWKQHLETDAHFGVRGRKEFTQEDYLAIVQFITGLDPDRRREFLLNIVFFCTGIQFGLRGRDEHRGLVLDDIVFGVYPWTSAPALANKEYVMIKGQLLAKANQVTMCK